MKNLSFLVLFIILFQISGLQSRSSFLHHKGKAQTQTLKQSVPFSQVLQNAITLMGSTYASQIDSELNNLRPLTQDQIVDYFKNTSYNGDVKLYWFRYYLLAQLSLFEERNWVRPQLEGQGPEDLLDENLASFKNHSDEYNAHLESCRKKSESFIGDKLHNLEYDYDILEKVQQDPFYQTVYSDLPKGVIHHLHWSASFNYKAYFEVISSNLQNQPQNDDRTVYISTRVSLEDVTVGGVMNEKSFVKFFLTKYSYLKPENLASLLASNKAALDSFRSNYVNGTSCLNFQINKKGYSVDSLDASLRGFLYSQACSNVVIYDDQLASQNVPGAVSFSKLQDALKDQDHVFETLEQAYNELPQAYLEDNKESTKNLQLLGVWYRFEQIFSGQTEITGDKTNFQKLTDRLFAKLKEQKVLAVELRNKNDSFQVQSFVSSSNNSNVPFSYVVPGRKVSGSSNKGATIVSDAEKNKDIKFGGVDFFGFEDDPYNGARNFFTMRLTQILSGDTISNFDRLFKYLDQENGSIILHSGETAYLPSPPITQEYAENNYINDNLIHAALLPGVKRIGHGFEVEQTALLINILQARDISLEVCPISNQVLNFHDVDTNPFVDLLRDGIHMSISPDDPGLFGYEGVANDWYWILKETDLRPDEVYLLLVHSLEHSTVSEVVNNQKALENQLAEDLHTFFHGLPNKCGLGGAKSNNEEKNTQNNKLKNLF